MADHLSYEEIKGQKRAVTLTVAIPLDSDLADEYREAQLVENEARQAYELFPADPQRLATFEEAKEKVEDAYTALEPHLAHFTFKALGSQQFADLLAEHPATKAQRDKWRKENPQIAAMGGHAQYNDETFPIALLSACAVTPALTESDAKDLWHSEVFSQAEVAELFKAAWDVNNRRSDLGKGSRPTHS